MNLFISGLRVLNSQLQSLKLNDKENIVSRYLYIYTLPACQSPINVKTAEPIGPKFCVGAHMTRGKDYEWLKFQKLASNKIRFSLNLKKQELFYQIRELFLFLFLNVHKEKMFTMELEDAPWNPSRINFQSLLFYLFPSSVFVTLYISLLKLWQFSSKHCLPPPTSFF